MFTFEVPIVNNDLLAAILAGQISEEDIQNLKARSQKDRTKNFIILSICATVIIAAVIFIIAAAEYSLDTPVFYAMSFLIGFVLFCIFFTYRLLYYIIGSVYLSALKRLESGKSFILNKYKLNKINRNMLTQLKSGQIDPATANEILNQADYERSNAMPSFILVLLVCFALMAFVLFIKPRMNIEIEPEFWGFLNLLVLALIAFTVFLWYRILVRTEWINAVKEGINHVKNQSPKDKL